MKKTLLSIATLASLTIATMSQAQDSTTVKKEFVPSGKISGQFIGDYFFKAHADSALRSNTIQYGGVAKNYDAFAIRRIYLGYDYQMSEHFATQLLIANESDNLDANGERTFYIKAANIRWKNFVKNNDLIIGQSSTPVSATVTEAIWGYRSIEKTVIDMRALARTNELGIALQGKLNDKGDYGYNFMIGNGGKGGQFTEVDKNKKGYGELYAKFLDQKIVVDVNGSYEEVSVVNKQYIETGKLAIAYVSKPFVVGVELVSQNQANAATDTTNGKKNAKLVYVTPFAVSAYVRGQFIENRLFYFARYDSYNPNTSYTPSHKYSTAGMITNKERFFTTGLDYTPLTNVHIMPNIWYDKYTTLKDNVKGSHAKSDYDL